MYIEYKLTDSTYVDKSNEIAEIRLALINWVVEHNFEDRYREIKIDVKSNNLRIRFPSEEFYSLWGLTMPVIKKRNGTETHEFKIVSSRSTLDKFLNAFRN